MSLDDFSSDIESGEGGGNSSEQSREVSEKFKESVKRAGAGIKRTQKDEKKAKKHDLLLANFLIKIILDKKYDAILPFLFKAMDSGYPSNFLLGILSLIYIQISHKIRELAEMKEVEFNYYSDEQIEFQDDNLDERVKIRINEWVDDISAVLTIDYSSVTTSKLKESLEDNSEIVDFTSEVFAFFLEEINIIISKGKSMSISEFILGEVKKSIKELEVEEI